MKFLNMKFSSSLVMHLLAFDLPWMIFGLQPPANQKISANNITNDNQPLARKWKCGCGALEVELRNEPVFCVNCHCHSCVAAGRYIDSLDVAQTNKGTSELDPNAGGAAEAFYKIQDISSMEELSKLKGKLGYIKVGPDGDMVRSYSKCCGTPFVIGGSTKPMNSRPINRCAIYNPDGSTLNENLAKPPPNIMLKHAFETESVPEPKSQLIGLRTAFRVLKMVFGYKLGRGLGTDWKEKDEIFFCDPKDAEVVPITWK